MKAKPLKKAGRADQWYIRSLCFYVAKRHQVGEDMMSSEAFFSILVWCKPDLQNETTPLRVVRVDTGTAVNFSESSFLLRISIDAKASVLRCFIRHIASGSEAYMQGGPKLRTFVETCLLRGGTQEPGTPEVSGK